MASPGNRDCVIIVSVHFRYVFLRRVKTHRIFSIYLRSITLLKLFDAVFSTHLWAYYNCDSSTIRVRFERDTTSYEELCAFEQ